MKNRVLILWPNKNEDWPQIIQQNYNELVVIDDLYKKTNIFGRIIRKGLSKLGLSTRAFFGNWYKKRNEFDTIMIHANEITQTVPNVLRKKKFKGRIIYWYWDPVANCVNPKKISRALCELWSFDFRDSQEYNMRYNSTYYFSRISSKSTKDGKKAFFLGLDKKRFDKLNKLGKVLKSVDIETDFHIIRDKTSMNSSEYYSSYMNYQESLEHIIESKCIVDIVQENQSGLTLRIMEGLFFGKKIITNNNNIKKEAFYNDTNFFVIEDFERIDSVDLKKFMEKDFLIDDSIDKFIQYYDFSNWLKRFDEI